MLFVTFFTKCYRFNHYLLTWYSKHPNVPEWKWLPTLERGANICSSFSTSCVAPFLCWHTLYFAKSAFQWWWQWLLSVSFCDNFFVSSCFLLEATEAYIAFQEKLGFSFLISIRLPIQQMTMLVYSFSICIKNTQQTVLEKKRHVEVFYKTNYLFLLYVKFVLLCEKSCCDEIILLHKEDPVSIPSKFHHWRVAQFELTTSPHPRNNLMSLHGATRTYQVNLPLASSLPRYNNLWYCPNVYANIWLYFQP